MTELQKYIADNVNRGPCTCGRCIDGIGGAENKQPDGHTADLIFFKVSTSNGANKSHLKKLINKTFPKLLDGEEHSYLEIGGDIGDQGMALSLMGIGKLLGLWELLTPKSMGMPEELISQMAGMGMITIKA